MALEITVATTDEYLTTTSAVKAVLGITTTSDDARIDEEILRASKWAETVVGYPLTAQKYRETMAAYGSRRLMTARTPLRSVSTLFYGTDTGDDATELTSTEFGVEHGPGFLTRTEGWEWSVPVESELSVTPRVGQEFEPWLADYTAGYVYGGMTTDSDLWSTVKGTTSTGRTLPRDIERAVIEKVQNQYTGIDGVWRKRVGDLDITYGAGEIGEVKDRALEWLKPYIRTA